MADFAERIEAAAPGATANPPACGEDEAFALSELAEWEYRLRRHRDALFREDLFGEPAWDMLLDLYVSEAKGRTSTVTDLCLASCRPQSTALRWIARLERDGLVIRSRSRTDHRTFHLELTAQGKELMHEHLMYRMRSLLSEAAHLGQDKGRITASPRQVGWK